MSDRPVDLVSEHRARCVELAKRDGMKANGGSAAGPCPACGGDDRFHVRLRGAPVFGCRKGCTFESILRAAGLWREPAEGDGLQTKRLVEAMPGDVCRLGKGDDPDPADYLCTARYEYRDEHGTVAGWVCRAAHVRGGKSVKIPGYLAPDGKARMGGHVKNPAMAGLPYRLPDVMAALEADSGRPLVVVEGEQCADDLAALGYAATTNAGGAAGWVAAHTKRLPHGRLAKTALQPASNRPAVLLPDADRAGMARIVDLGRSLRRAAYRVVVVMPDAMGFDVRESGGMDVSDWLAADPGRDDAAVDRLIAGAVSLDDAILRVPAEDREPRHLRPNRAVVESGDDGGDGDGRPVITVSPGDGLRMRRSAVKLLVSNGPSDDRRSFYASPAAVALTGEPTGYMAMLRVRPAVGGNDAALWHNEIGPDSTAGADGSIVWPGGEPAITGATAKAVKTRLAEIAEWNKPHPKLGHVPTDVTDSIAGDVIEQYAQDSVDGPRLRLLNGIVDAPTMRADGSVIDRPGYDSTSGLYAAFDSDGWPAMPQSPSRDDAVQALAKLHAVVQETTFAEGPQYRAVWVASLLTIVGREYARGNVPMFCISANHRGAGKTCLVDMATAIATGRPAAKWSPPGGRRQDAEAEEDKRLTTVAMDGTRVLLYDNLRAGEPIGTPALDRALTSGADSSMGVVAGRLLGKSEKVQAPWRVVVFATGNNLATRGDLDRRILLCRLHTDSEKPETRLYERKSPVDYCMEHRRDLLVSCLTILRAHKLAIDRGETKPLPPWGSFVAWSDRIRSALVWADPDGVDPKDTADEAAERAHPEQADAAAFLAACHAVFGDKPITVGQIDAICRDAADGEAASPAKYKALLDAVSVLDIAPPRGKSAVNVRSLGNWMVAAEDRPGPYVVRKVGSDRSRRYYVERTGEVADMPKTAEEPKAEKLRDLADVAEARAAPANDLVDEITRQAEATAASYYDAGTKEEPVLLRKCVKCGAPLNADRRPEGKCVTC